MPTSRRPAHSRPDGGHVNLQVERLSPAYRGRLLRAFAALRSWSTEHNFDFDLLVNTPDVLNSVLVQFLQDLFEIGASVSLATHAVLAVQTLAVQTQLGTAF